jgi:hypothetical protein
VRGEFVGPGVPVEGRGLGLAEQEAHASLVAARIEVALGCGVSQIVDADLRGATFVEAGGARGGLQRLTKRTLVRPEDEARLRRAALQGECAGRQRRSRCGAVTHVQRFGSSINLNVHFHVTVLDGVFTHDDQRRPVFHPVPPPTRYELTRIVETVRRRAIAWLTRRGHTASALEARSQESAGQTPLEACAAIAMQRGSMRALPDTPTNAEEAPLAPDAPPVEAGAVERDGFNLHASVRIAADDDLGRERLMRYGARPPLALDRLRSLPGGRISYLIKKLRDGRAKHRVMTPLEFLARLAAIVAPPRYPLLRYHGVLAPRSSWRQDVVPKTPKPLPCQQDVSATPLRLSMAGEHLASVLGRLQFGVTDDGAHLLAVCENAGPNGLEHFVRIILHARHELDVVGLAPANTRRPASTIARCSRREGGQHFPLSPVRRPTSSCASRP